jgi:hypothetical protein
MREDYPRAFAGAIATCAPAAGFARGMDRHLDFTVAYAAAFGWPDADWGPLENLKENLNFQTEVLPKLQTPRADGGNRGQWEFIRLVRGISPESFWGVNPVYNMQGWLINMALSTWGRATNQSFAAGPFAQNQDHRYNLTAPEKAYLAGLNINADELLTRMNARTNIQATPCSRDYVDRFGSPRGLLRRPALTLHNTQDNVAEAAHESAYLAAARWWKAESNLYQAYVTAPGHCVFTSSQLLTALAAMERWLDTGQRPATADFPEAEGFENTFTPPPWPY